MFREKLTAHDTDEIDLLRVRAQISSAGYECPDLCRRLGETAEDAVVRVLEQYRKVNTKGPRVSPSMSKSRSRELEQASQEWLDHRAQLEAKDSETRDLQQQLLQKDSRSIEDAMKHKAKLASLKEEKRSAIKKLYQKCEALKVEVATLTLQVQEQSTTYAERLKRDKEQLEIEQETHERRLHDIQKHVGKEVLEKQKDHESSLDRLRKQLDAERATRETYMAELETAKALVRQQELHAKAQFDKQEKRYIEASLRERAVHGKEMADYQSQIHHQREHLQELQKTEDERTVNNQQRMAIELQKQKTSLTEQHNAEKYALLVIIEDFKLASATRDRPKGLTDTDLVTRFSKLAQDVEDFARLEWDPACEAQRWTQQLNQLNPRNRRKLKQKLIQNSLWISLHEHVFRSPYRLLAAEQEWQDLDKPWIEIYAFGK
jgi:chromosome segregation ATPase